MKLTGIQTKVLSGLLDKYEKSVTFTGKNKVSQSFAINIEKAFPRYLVMRITISMLRSTGI